MIKILFICHGNICRSTMAEFVMKHMVKKAGLEDEFFIQSAATHRDELGSDTHYGTKHKLDKEGIPYTKRRARLMQRSDYDKYDFIIGMDEENMRYIRRIIGGNDSEHKVHKLLNFAGENRSVADPWYTDNFDETYADICKGCRALLESVINHVK